MMDFAQCRAGRAMLGWSQDRLAELSHVNKKTVADFERGVRQPYERTLRDLRETMESAGVLFIDDGAASDVGGGPGVRLRSTPSVD